MVHETSLTLRNAHRNDYETLVWYDVTRLKNSGVSRPAFGEQTRQRTKRGRRNTLVNSYSTTASRELTPGYERQNEVTPHFRGHWLMLARMLWIALAILILILYVFGFPAGFRYLKTICVGTGCGGPQLTPDQVRVFSAHGLSLDFFATYTLAFEFIFVAVWFLVAAVIFWRKSNERLAWFVSLMLLTFGATFPDLTNDLASQQPAWWWPVNVVAFLGVVSLVLCFFLFPDGRFVPRWTGLVGLLWILWNLYWLFSTGLIVSPGPWLLSYLGLLGLGVFAQIYRYWHVSNTVQRQQTRWAVYGFSIAIVAFLLLGVAGHVFTPFQKLNPFLILLINPAYYLFMLLIPVSISIAILRSRLWDIDILINRTLVYGALTATLALIYIGLIIALQFLLRGIIDQNNNIAIVGSTLAIYVLFQPLRRRIQHTIDRRFYRRKYDATRTLAAFSATLRAEVDLAQLSEQLVAVVEETMQPAHISLWINKSHQSPSAYYKQEDLPFLQTS